MWDKAGASYNEPCQQVFSRNNEEEIAHNFIYVGSEIDANGACGNEIRWQMTLTEAAGSELCNSVYKIHDVSLSLKLHLPDMSVVSVTEAQAVFSGGDVWEWRLW